MNIRKKLIKLNILLFMILVICITIIMIFDVSKNEKKIINAQKREIYAQSGTCGTCTWTIDNNGLLTIKPTSGTSGTLANYNLSPWIDYASSIISVTFNATVYGNTSCDGLFLNCTNLTSLNLTNFNTSNVEDMGGMFQGCSKLTSLNLTNFNTSNVEDMGGMFQGCSKLTSLNLTNFNTSNVENMSNMFKGCSSLLELDLSSFDTSNVKNMGKMFQDCSKLTSLNVSSFNTTNVLYIGYMFSNCSSLTDLNLSNFKTSKLKEAYNVFQGCTNLKSVNISKFNTNNVSNYAMPKWFNNCPNLRTIVLGKNLVFKNDDVLDTYTEPWLKVGTTTPTYTSTELMNNYSGSTMYGTYQRVAYKIVFNGNDSTTGSTASMDMIYGTAKNLTMNGFTKVGYTFNGWNTKADGTGTSYSNGQSVNNLTTSDGDTVTLYAKWEAINYTVTYNANGGTVSPLSKTVNYDMSYGELAIPEKTGYTFNGWSLLPPGYKMLEYIESTGTQYIDSGYKPNTRTGVDVTYEFTNIYSQERIFGVQGKNDITDSMTFEVYVSNDLTYAYAYKDGDGNWTNLSKAVDTNIHRLKFNVEENYIKIDNTRENLNCLATHQAPYNMKIMATNQDVFSQGISGGKASIKIYAFSIYEAGVLQKKFIPCKNSNNEVGLYDIVNDVFHGNIGTDTFVEGPEIFVTASSIVELPFNHNLYANYTINTYKVEYYQGNNTTTAGATKLGEQSFTYGETQNLTTYAALKTSSDKTEPQSWVFYGWSANNGTTVTSRTYTDGQSVNNLTVANNGIIKIYAIFKRTIKFNSGLNCATTSTAEQRYNPYKTTGSITAVSAPAPSTTGLTNSEWGWSPIGYRANKTAANRTYAVTTTATNITPAYNVYDVSSATSNTVNLYAVYSRTVTLYHGLNHAQNSTPIQYMNTSGNAVSNITAPAPSVTGLSDYGWEASGYRADEDAIDVSN